MKARTALRAASAATLTIGLGIGVASFAGADNSVPPWAQSRQALFVETDATSGNTILAYNRASDGTISFAGSYATGGNGGTASGATADPLASQDGLTLVDHGQELIAVNAGSNTVTVFAVNGTQLNRVQQISSRGFFPVSVASNNRLVSVLNAGGAGSVSEYALQGGLLVPLSGQVRALVLGGSLTAPPDYHHGAGEVSYTPNGKFLIVATKQSTNAYDVFTVAGNGNLGTSSVDTSSVIGLPFAFVFDAAGNVVAAEAGTSNVTTYRVNGDGTLTSLGTITDDETALCWISGANGYFYGSNAGSGNVSSFDESSTGAPQLISSVAATAHAGTTDSVVSPDGKYLYVESGGAGTVDTYAIGAGGSLTQIETIFNIPVASEGIAIS